MKAAATPTVLVRRLWPRPKHAAEAERLRSLREIESATDGALRSLAERSAQLAVELAGKIVRRTLIPADHKRLIDEAVEKFTVTPSQN